MLNCGGRCVYTNAIAIRCEAAHLKAHARKGGASFKNGLLLRADIHKLFDVGLCAIDPLTLKLWFAPDLVKKDADLAAIDGITMRKTLLPINKDNIEDRWDAFVKILLA
ncbi:HNH endonuclease [Klebsiella pneumoniae]